MSFFSRVMGRKSTSSKSTSKNESETSVADGTSGDEVESETWIDTDGDGDGDMDSMKEDNIKSGFIAGSSFTHRDDLGQSIEKKADESAESTEKASGDEGGKDEDDAHSWKHIDESTFSLRIGPNYSRTGAKAPSGQSLFELVGIDCVQCSARIDNIGSKVSFPNEWTDVVTNNEFVEPIFIVNAQIPSNFTTSLFETISDGPGWSLVHYFRIRPEVAASYANNMETASNAAKLFADYCKEAPAKLTDSYSPWYGRFKICIRCDNIDEFGLPSFITSYNAKPVLIRNTGSLHRGTDYMEMDINVHKFGTVPKKALSIMLNNFEHMRLCTGFCIESRQDAEMPETLLGCAGIIKPNYKISPNL
jgi:hypothetical protein